MTVQQARQPIHRAVSVARVCLLLLLMARPVSAAPTRVQFFSGHDQTGSGATVATSQVTVTNGNVLVGAAQWASSTTTFTSITRTGGTDTGTIGSVTSFTDFATSSVSGTTFWIPVTSSGTVTLTLTLSGNSNKNLIVWEVSGMDAVTPVNAHGGVRYSFDGTPGDDPANGVTTGNITTTVDNCLILGFMSANLQTVNAGTGFTSQTNGSGNTWGVTAEYMPDQGTQGAVAATWSRTAGGAVGGALNVIAVAPAAGGAAATCQGKLSLLGVGCHP